MRTSAERRPPADGIRGDAGVSGVEYALILALVVVGVLLALSGFSTHAEEQLTDRGNRVGNPDSLNATDLVPVGPPSTTAVPTTAPPPASTTTTTTTTTTSTTIVLPTTTTTTTVPPGPGPTSTTTTTTTTIVSSVPHAFVGSMTGSSARSGGSWTATVLVTVVDQHGDPLSGVQVGGGWSESTAHVADCVTGVDGSCTVSQTDLKRSGAAAVPSTTYHVLSLSGDGIVAAGPDADDNLEVLRP